VSSRGVFSAELQAEEVAVIVTARRHSDVLLRMVTSSFEVREALAKRAYGGAARGPNAA
jgi:hypothetical protein